MRELKNDSSKPSKTGTGQPSSDTEGFLAESNGTLGHLLTQTLDENERLVSERDSLTEVLQVASRGIDQLGSVMSWFHSKAVMEIQNGGYKRREVFLPPGIDRLVPVTAAEAMDASDVRFLLRTAMAQPDGEHGESITGFLLGHIGEQWGKTPPFPLEGNDLDRFAIAVIRRYDLLPANQRGA